MNTFKVFKMRHAIKTYSYDYYEDWHLVDDPIVAIELIQYRQKYEHLDHGYQVKVGEPEIVGRYTEEWQYA